MSWGKRQRVTNLATHTDAMAMGADCRSCFLFMTATKPVLGEGSISPLIAVVGDYPSTEESAAGKPFLGRSGETLESVLLEEGTSRTNVYLDHAVACFPPEGDLRVATLKARKAARANGTIKTFRSPVDCCRARLFNALGIRKCGRCMKWERGPMTMTCACVKAKTAKLDDKRWLPQPKGTRSVPITVPAGNFALESIVGVTGIQKWRGSPLDMAVRAAGTVAEVRNMSTVEAARKKVSVAALKKRVKKSKKLKFTKA